MAPTFGQSGQSVERKSSRRTRITQLPPSSFPPFPEITMKEIENTIRSFPNASSGGFDVLQLQHLKNMMSGTSEQSINNFLTTMSPFTINPFNPWNSWQGLIPESVFSILYVDRLIALKKPDDCIRPIVVGNVLRRILGKIVRKRMMNSTGNVLRPLQLGYGTPKGAEAVDHATRDFLEDGKDGEILLKLDFNNAFNDLFRDNVLKKLNNYFPEFYPFIHNYFRSCPYLLLVGCNKDTLLDVCYSVSLYII